MSLFVIHRLKTVIYEKHTSAIQNSVYISFISTLNDTCSKSFLELRKLYFTHDVYMTAILSTKYLSLFKNELHFLPILKMLKSNLGQL